MEMPDTETVNTKLSNKVSPRPVCMGLMPRSRMPTNAAPMSPNTAPDAPPVSASGFAMSAPVLPAKREAKYTKVKRVRPMSLSIMEPSW